jgi:hypothetical protein
MQFMKILKCSITVFLILYIDSFVLYYAQLSFWLPAVIDYGFSKHTVIDEVCVETFIIVIAVIIIYFSSLNRHLRSTMKLV